MKMASRIRVQFLLALLWNFTILSGLLSQAPIVTAAHVSPAPKTFNSTLVVKKDRPVSGDLTNRTAAESPNVVNLSSNTTTRKDQRTEKELKKQHPRLPSGDTNNRTEAKSLNVMEQRNHSISEDLRTIKESKKPNPRLPAVDHSNRTAAEGSNSTANMTASEDQTTIKKSKKPRHRPPSSDLDANRTIDTQNVDQNHSSNMTTQDIPNNLAPPRKPFRLGPRIKNWDEQREAWLKKYPYKRLTPQNRPRMILVTGSPPTPCGYPTGDQFLTRSFKNKLDYGRLHVVDVYYNMAVMEMGDFWVKLPIVRKLMVRHPEAEWIWWMDSDAIFTDMNFEIPLERYEGKNMVIHGWKNMVYRDRDWTGLNAGIFLLRNCQWSLDLLDMWAPMGEDYGNHKNEVGYFLSQQLKGRPDFESDDQAGLIWLLLSKPELRSKVFLEDSYKLHGWWMELTEHFEEMAGKSNFSDGSWPFITHFVGCKFCSGRYNSTSLELCTREAEKAFNFADNQVLRSYGYRHESLSQLGVEQFSEESTHPLEQLYGISLNFTV